MGYLTRLVHENEQEKNHLPFKRAQKERNQEKWKRITPEPIGKGPLGPIPNDTRVVPQAQPPPLGVINVIYRGPTDVDSNKMRNSSSQMMLNS